MQKYIVSGVSLLFSMAVCVGNDRIELDTRNASELYEDTGTKNHENANGNGNRSTADVQSTETNG